jgi:hypothetical protein
MMLGGPTLEQVLDIEVQALGSRAGGRMPVPEGHIQIGYRLTGTEAQTGGGKPISLPEVVDAVAGILEAAGKGNVPIRTGRVPKGFAGIFKIYPEVIRVKQANNVTTATHEVFHALEKALFGLENLKGKPEHFNPPAVPEAVTKELHKLGFALYGSTKPVGGYVREGWAEFGRLFVTMPEMLNEQAPHTTRWFESSFLMGQRGVGEAIDHARQAVATWRFQGTEERFAAMEFDPASAQERWRRMKGEAGRLFSWQSWTDMLDPVRRYVAEYEKLHGKLPVEQDPYAYGEAFRSTSEAIVTFAKDTYQQNMQGARVGPALNEATALVDKAGMHMGEFGLYLAARRIRALWRDPLRTRHQPMSLADAEAMIRTYEQRYPVAEQAAQKVYTWLDNWMDYAAQASQTMGLQKANIERYTEKARLADPNWSPDYVPMPKEISEMLEAWPGARNRFFGKVSGGQAYKFLKGSGRRFKSVMPSILEHANLVARQAHKEAILERLHQMSKSEGMGWIFEEVPRGMELKAKADVDRVWRELVSKYSQEMLNRGIEPDPKAMQDMVGETISIWGPARFPKGVDPVVARWDPQTKSLRWFHVEPNLYHALTAMDVYRLPQIAEFLLRMPRDVFIMGTTGARMAFGWGT